MKKQQIKTCLVTRTDLERVVRTAVRPVLVQKIVVSTPLDG
jgi:hypothetical protein